MRVRVSVSVRVKVKMRVWVRERKVFFNKPSVISTIRNGKTSTQRTKMQEQQPKAAEKRGVLHHILDDIGHLDRLYGKSTRSGRDDGDKDSTF